VPAEPDCELRFSLNSSRLMTFNLGARTMAELATTLQMEAGRLVQDETGLTGRFDIGLEFTTDSLTFRFSRDSPPPPPPAEGLSVFEALEQQLGLRLESRLGPVRMIVVEHAERPSPN